MTAVNSVHYASCKINMVILKQNHVEQSDAMVATTANLNGLLFQHTHARSGLTSVEHAGLGAFQMLYVTVGHSGDATHALHDVQHQALRLQQRAHLACDDHGNVALLHTTAVAHEHFHLHLRVETVKHLLGNLHTCQDTILLDEQVRLAHRVLWDTTQGGMVTVTYIFCKRQINQSVNKFFYAQHNLLSLSFKL